MNPFAQVGARTFVAMRGFGRAALFFADPASAFITGVAIEVDGGRCI